MTNGKAPEDLPLAQWPEWNYFDGVTLLLAELIAKVQIADASRVGVLFPLLDSIQESTSSLELLARRQALRDAYVVARVIYETAVNACFVLTNPADLSSRAKRHSKQKALRSLVRRIEIAGARLFEFRHNAADQLMEVPEHKQWLDEFTSNSGREITAWTPETVQQRLETVQSAFGADAARGLAFGLLIYRHASEIAHGTLYGTLFSWGAMEIGLPLTSPGDLGAFRRSELRHLLKLVCFSLESLIRVASTAVNAAELGASAEAVRRGYYAQREMVA